MEINYKHLQTIVNITRNTSIQQVFMWLRYFEKLIHVIYFWKLYIQESHWILWLKNAEHYKHNRQLHDHRQSPGSRPHSPPHPEGRTKSVHRRVAAVDEDTPSNSPVCFWKCNNCLLDSIGGCGDVTGILGHKYIAIFCSFLNSWYTLSSETTSWLYFWPTFEQQIGVSLWFKNHSSPCCHSPC